MGRLANARANHDVISRDVGQKSSFPRTILFAPARRPEVALPGARITAINNVLPRGRLGQSIAVVTLSTNPKFKHPRTRPQGRRGPSSSALRRHSMGLDRVSAALARLPPVPYRATFRPIRSFSELGRETND